MTPPTWLDIAHDLDAARAHRREIVEILEGLPPQPPRARRNAELALAKEMHDAISALEKALERLVELVDGDLPRGRSSHRDLLDRAARTIPDLRPAILSAASRRTLGTLINFRHVLRHVYEPFEFDRALPNITLAIERLDGIAGELEAFARAIRLLPPET